jgi:hypothetical protein
MSEVLHRITSLEGQPKFMALMLIGLLFKVTGQQTFTLRELAGYMNEYDGIKVRYKEVDAVGLAPGTPNLEDSQVTITLHSKGE